MIASAPTDTISTAAVAADSAPGVPIFLIASAVFVIVVFLAVLVTVSYRLYTGPSFHDLIDGRTKRWKGK